LDHVWTLWQTSDQKPDGETATDLSPTHHHDPKINLADPIFLMNLPRKNFTATKNLVALNNQPNHNNHLTS
jgi:hypothetical protein